MSAEFSGPLRRTVVDSTLSAARLYKAAGYSSGFAAGRPPLSADFAANYVAVILIAATMHFVNLLL